MTFRQNNQYFPEANNHTEYDSTKPFASFEIDYTKKNIMSALKAHRHIIYTLSPIVTIFALFIYIFALYIYFTRIEAEIGNIPIHKIFTIMWCTIMTLMVVAVVAFFVTFEIIRLKKAKEILSQMPHRTEVKIYENRLEYIAENENIITIPYNELSLIKETEEYYFVTCKNNQMIILDKSKAKGYYSYLTDLANMQNIYTQSLISKNGQFEKIPPKKLAKIKNHSIRLIPLCIASIYVFIFFAAALISTISLSTGSAKIIIKAAIILIALSGNIFPLYSIIFGIKYKTHNIKTIKNIVVGAITLFYSSIFSLVICLASITL